MIKLMHILLPYEIFGLEDLKRPVATLLYLFTEFSLDKGMEKA